MTFPGQEPLPGLPYADEYVALRHVSGERIVVMERSAVPFPEGEAEIEEAFLGFVTVLRGLPQAELHLIIDSRRAPGRNDEAFERVQRKYRRDLFNAFRSTTVVLASVIGRMQVARYEREAGRRDSGQFASVEDAIEALRGT
ncbi:MAG: hypothetical protein AAF447_28015 [Myxococcota bacterium]